MTLFKHKPSRPPLKQDGIDYAATTIQSNYERIPFLFTVKDLVAKASAGGNQVKPGFQMGGAFKTPSYRTGLFLDPKGRGGSTGYDMAVALPGLQSGIEGDAELFKENNKVFEVTDGNIEFEVNKVDKEAGEIGGTLRRLFFLCAKCNIYWVRFGSVLDRHSRSRSKLCLECSSRRHAFAVTSYTE